MKKHACLFLAVAAMVAVTAFGFLAGCGNNEANARQYIEHARDKSAKVAENEYKIEKKGEELATFNELFQNITPETAEALKKYFAEIVALDEALNKAARETRKEYEKILELEGVPDFRKYAQNRIDAINLIERRSLLFKQFAAIYEELPGKALNGEPIDETLVKNQADQIIQQRDQVDRDLEKLNSRAAELAEKLDIE